MSQDDDIHFIVTSKGFIVEDRVHAFRRIRSPGASPGRSSFYLGDGRGVACFRGEKALACQSAPSKTGFVVSTDGRRLTLGQPSHSIMMGVNAMCETTTVHMENANRQVNHGRSLQQPKHTVPAGDSFCTGLRTQWEEPSRSVPRPFL
jgi:hypothetical protein